MKQFPVVNFTNCWIIKWIWSKKLFYSKFAFIFIKFVKLFHYRSQDFCFGINKLQISFILWISDTWISSKDNCWRRWSKLSINIELLRKSGIWMGLHKLRTSFHSKHLHYLLKLLENFVKFEIWFPNILAFFHSRWMKSKHNNVSTFSFSKTMNRWFQRTYWYLTLWYFFESLLSFINWEISKHYFQDQEFFSLFSKNNYFF